MTSARTIILVLYFIRGSLGHTAPQSPVVGVTGGHAVDIEHAPFMAALLLVDSETNDTDIKCGGSIIHKQFVLTTADCTEVSPSSIIVRVGSTRYDEGGQLHRVEKYIKHESYSDSGYTNNVALLKLSEPLTFGPSVAAIELADACVNIPVGLTANVTGWGYAFLEMRRNLQQASVTVSPQDDCDEYFYSFDIKLSNKQVCVKNSHSDHDTGGCSYDRGGPLTVGNLQISIYSFGAACWSVPNVYEKVAPHLQWIRNKIKQNL